MKKSIFLFFIFYAQIVFSQTMEDDFLQSKTYDSLITMYDRYASNPSTIKEIARGFIAKAKKDKDSVKIAKGYTRLASVSKPNVAIKFLDTALYYSKNSLHTNFPASVYLNKSILFFANEEYEKSLKNAISGYNSANNKNNISQQITALHQISNVNELWGDYRKALQTELLAYKYLFKNPDKTNYSENYLFSLEGIGKCYVRLKKPDSALIYFQKGITESLRKKDTVTYSVFVSRSAMALFEKKQYKKALDSLQKGDIFRDKYNNRYLSYYYYYAGNCHYNLGNVETSILFFQKIDSIYKKRHVLNPELPHVYDKLISYYKSKNNTQKELEYLYKLVRVNRIIDVKKIYIKDKTENEFFIPNLLEDKEDIIADLNKKNKNSKTITWGILIFLFLLILFLIYYVRRQQKFKKRYKHIIEKQVTTKNKKNSVKEESVSVSIETIQNILESLNTFELEKKYLSQEVSLNEIAKAFETNSTYLSKVINLKKDKNFSQYINDLRVEYIIKELDINSKFRKYTIKAIANECGFKSAESFSKAFYKKFGIYPSYYLRQLKNK